MRIAIDRKKCVTVHGPGTGSFFGHFWPKKVPVPFSPQRRGMTLVELLVVISILLILTVVALPAMQPAAESRRIREAARSINVFFGAARNRAVATGRPCGVLIERHEGLPNAGIALYQAEVPPPYAGGSINTAITSLGTPSQSLPQSTRTTITRTATVNETIDTKLISDGDHLQINHQGPWYTITVTGASQLTLSVILDAGIQLPWPSGGSVNLPFQIRRQPASRPIRSGTRPLLLPATTAIDLQWSGIGSDFFDDPTTCVAIMFSPNGNIDTCCYDGDTVRVTEPIFLLVGKIQQIGVEATVSERALETSDEDHLGNWQILTNLWVMITPQSGQVTVGEVAMAPDITESRSIVAEGQSMGGR